MKSSHLEYHRDSERDHWWFAARRQIVLAALDSALGDTQPSDRPNRRLLDIGCGAGGFLAFLSRRGAAVGVDASPDAVAMASELGSVDVRLGSLPDDVPFPESSFDVVTLLDVLEHVRRDDAALGTIRHLLRPSGLLIVTVPAYPALWSGHDEVNDHKRRYVRRELSEKLHTAGFIVHRITYFNTLLFPPIALLRVIDRLTAKEPRASTGRVPAPINALLRSIFAFEKHLLAASDLPYGL
ncbi:MAG TPA: class I SAM-dependent methyltransferase, partial [Gemmatimonadaceae bacterium]|nr:class I SAM-dependent methyltransferase [Gemmatimonadaceae bacterium]